MHILWEALIDTLIMHSCVVLLCTFLSISSNRPAGPIRSSSRDVCVCVYVCMCVCVSVPFHVVYFKAYFAPTSQSPMSKIFRDWNSVGKVLEEVVSELIIFVGMWSKIATQKKVCFLLTLPYQTHFPMD